MLIGPASCVAHFQGRGGNGTIWLAEDAIWITVVERSQVERPQVERPHVQRANVEHVNVQRKGVNLKLSFPGASPHPRLEPFNRLDTHVS